jgi:sensor histidine kinase YesM
MPRIKFYWTLQLSCWFLYVSYVAAGIYYYTPNVKGITKAALFNLAILVLGTHIYRIVVRSWDIESLPRWYNFMIYPVIGNVLISGIVSTFNIVIFHFDDYLIAKQPLSIAYFIFQFLNAFRFVMPWFVFYHGIRLTERAVQSERDKNQAQMQLKIVELDNLKNQLNPHFLFNSLNSIRSLTLSDPKLARDATTKLSDLLRIYLTFNELQDITLEEEINLVMDYLTIEKIRFENRLHYKIEVDKKVLQARILPMSLQLLAENAVKHGIGNTKNGGEIIIFARRENNSLKYGVRNTGNLTENIEKNKRKGLGLVNLQKRLLLNYGITDGLKIISKDNMVIAEVCVPL